MEEMEDGKMLLGFILGLAVGVLFTCWRYNVNRGALVRQAQRVAEVFTLGNTVIGPELQKLGRIHFGGRI